jgi:DHA3 family macrolide efflux protein-like MFS transporter
MTSLGYIIFGFLLERMPIWILLGICGICTFILIFYHIWKKTFAQHLREAGGPIAQELET